MVDLKYMLRTAKFLFPVYANLRIVLRSVNNTTHHFNKFINLLKEKKDIYIYIYNFLIKFIVNSYMNNVSDHKSELEIHYESSGTFSTMSHTTRNDQAISRP